MQTAHFKIRPTKDGREAHRYNRGQRDSALTSTQNQERFKQDINTTIYCDGMLNIAQGFNSPAWCKPYFKISQHEKSKQNQTEERTQSQAFN